MWCPSSLLKLNMPQTLKYSLTYAPLININRNLVDILILDAYSYIVFIVPVHPFG